MNADTAGSWVGKRGEYCGTMVELGASRIEDAGEFIANRPPQMSRSVLVGGFFEQTGQKNDSDVNNSLLLHLAAVVGDKPPWLCQYDEEPFAARQGDVVATRAMA